MALADLLLLAVLECAWCWPLPVRGASAIPGAPGDNLSILWNFWWMRKALATPGLHVFDTGYLFYPLHTDLVLNAHTALNAFVGATLLAPLSIVSALNVTILAGLVLGAFGAYALAWELTGNRCAAVAAGVIFGQCPCLAAHLAGHFNLTSAWVLPWFLLAFGRMLDRRSFPAAIGAGLCLIAAAYTDYYYLVFATVSACAWLLIRWWRLAWTVERRRPRAATVRAVRVLAGLLVLDLIVATTVFVTGGGVLHIGPVPMSMTQTFNLREIAWTLVIILALIFWRVRLRVRRAPDAPEEGRPGRTAARDLAMLGLLVAVFLAGIIPLAVHAIRIVLGGDYVSQTYSWKSAPQGIDLVALVSGNPFHPLWGRLSETFRARLGFDPVESVAWLGIVPAWLGWIGWRRFVDPARRRRWALLLVLFFVWALGPFLHVGGFNTGLVLPETLNRFVPILANARIPGRAMVMVYLALAMFAAAGLASLRGRWSRPAWQWAAVGFIAFGYLRAPMTMYRPVPSPVSEQIAASHVPGAVVNLPLGLADAFGDRGPFDRRELYFQTIAERPMAGGFVARLSPRVIAAYRELPVLGPWWRLSEGESLPAGEVPRGREAVDALRREGFAFVVLDRATAPHALTRSVESLALPLILRDGSRELYLVAAKR